MRVHLETYVTKACENDMKPLQEFLLGCGVNYNVFQIT